jgi:uncharacterized protein YjiS (DUF1127 family)
MLKHIIDWFEDYQARRVAYIQLNYLSDRQLNDLGLSRSQLKEKINGSRKKQKESSQRGWKLYKTSNA